MSRLLEHGGSRLINPAITPVTNVTTSTPSIKRYLAEPAKDEPWTPETARLSHTGNVNKGRPKAAAPTQAQERADSTAESWELVSNGSSWGIVNAKTDDGNLSSERP